MLIVPRRKLLKSALAAPFVLASAHAQMGVPGGASLNLSGAVASVPTGPTTFDPAHVSLTLSSGNLIATNSGGGIYSYARSIASHSTGKFYWEIRGTAVAGVGNGCIGIGNASATGYTGGGSYPGSDINSGATFDNNAAFYVNGANIGQCLPAYYVGGDAIGIALDVGAKLIWLRSFHLSVASNWNNSGTANPATGVGGLSIASLTGAIYAYVWITVAGDSYTANFGATGFYMSAPTGFGNL